jgi:hypothetical protein
MRTLALALALAFLLSSSIAAAHSGGTDRDGGHYDHKTGIYHYHNPKPGY